MRDTIKYGRYYWCIKTTKDISTDGEIYLMADSVDVGIDGSLKLLGKKGAINLILPSGKWKACFAASMLDGHAVAVEHWKDEVVSPIEEISCDYEEEEGKEIIKIISRKSISKGTRYDVLKRDKSTCQSCGKTAKETILHIDHVTPVASGGKSTIDNLQVLCKDCNLGKGKKND